VKPIDKVLLVTVSAAAALLGLYYLLSAENARRQSQPEIAGWDDIDACGSLKSFDGTKTLDFDRSHKVSLIEKSSSDADKAERKVDGTWSFDEEKERYVVSLGAGSTEYELIKPEEASVCILTSSDVGAVDLRESWFARIDDE
jgi:hypothetical protein